MLDRTVAHFEDNVLPSADEYGAAEEALSVAFISDQSPEAWKSAALLAKRRAAAVAIAIDGLTDRCESELGVSKVSIRAEISRLCVWPENKVPRTGAHDRVRAVANAYKHGNLNDLSLPLSSEDDVLIIELGFGLDGLGVGKFGGVEVLVRDRCDQLFCFRGDVPVSLGAWFRFLETKGIKFSRDSYKIFGVQVYPS